MVKGRESWNTLNYSKQRLTDDDIPGLKLSQEHRSFVEVDFSSNQLTAAGLGAIVKFCVKCPDLCVFKAFKNHISDTGAHHIAKLIEECTSIEEVHLSHNYLTAKGVRIIVRAADQRKHNSPLWLRVEQNYVASGADFLRVMAQEFSVCGRNDDWRCTSRHCYWKRNIHVPFLHLQRQDWDDWQESWADDYGWEESWKASKSTKETTVSSQTESAKASKAVEEPYQKEAEQEDDKGKQRWTVKQVEENPVREWVKSVSQVWAPVDTSKAKESERPKAKAKEAKEIDEKPVKSTPEEAKDPKDPKNATKKKNKEDKKEVAVKEKGQAKAAAKDAKKKVKEANDPKTSNAKEDAKAAKLEAQKLLDAPKLQEGTEQKWAMKGNKVPPQDVIENIPMPVGLQRQESYQTDSLTTTAGGDQDESKHVSRRRKNSSQLEEKAFQAGINALPPPPSPFLGPSFLEQEAGVPDNSRVFAAAEDRLLRATQAKNCMISKEDEKQAETFIQELNAIIKEDLDPERHCHAQLFGSMSTGFGTQGCDFDVVISTVNTPESEANKDVLMKLRKILLEKPEFEIKNVILTARVPILKLEYGGRDVDVSVNNEKALKNSRLLHAYAQLDPMIAEFGIAVKVWAKDAQLCGAKDGHLSSYAFILMALYFLQVGGDEMPCLQEGLDESWATADDEALHKRVQAAKASWKLPTRDIWTLLAGFFAFYAGSVGPTGQCHPFQWGEEVVSVRLGKRARTLICSQATEFHDLKGRQEGHLHIEDPVEQSRNLRDVLRLHPADHELLLVSEMRLMDNQCRLQAQAMICRGQMMWDQTPRDFPDFTPMPNMRFGLQPSLLPPPVPPIPPMAPMAPMAPVAPMPANVWHPGNLPVPGFHPFMLANDTATAKAKYGRMSRRTSH